METLSSWGWNVFHLGGHCRFSLLLRYLAVSTTYARLTYGSKGDFPVKEVAGEHLLYFVFEGGAGICNFKQFRFTAGETGNGASSR